MPKNTSHIYSMSLAAVAARRRQRAARTPGELKTTVSKPLQEVLNALYLGSKADLILCLLEREAFLGPWTLFRDEVIWGRNPDGLIIRIDDLIPQIIEEVKYHVIRLYSSLIRNLQQKDELFYACGEDEYPDICESLAKLANFLQAQYKSGEGYLIRVIERAKPSRHTRLSAELIKTGDYYSAVEYREKKMARNTVAANVHEDEDYGLLREMFVDSANESIHRRATTKKARVERSHNDRSPDMSFSGGSSKEEIGCDMKEAHPRVTSVETMAAVKMEGVKSVRAEENQIDDTDEGSMLVDYQAHVECCLDSFVATSDEEVQDMRIKKLCREDDGHTILVVKGFPTQQHRIMLTSCSEINQVQEASNSLENSEIEDDDDQVIPIKDLSMDDDVEVNGKSLEAEGIWVIDFAFINAPNRGIETKSLSR